MHRYATAPIREDYEKLSRDAGLTFFEATYVDALTGMERPIIYPAEGRYYEFKDSESVLIGHAGAVLFQAILKLCEQIVKFEISWHGDSYHKDSDCYMRKLGIPERAIGPVIRSWQADPDGAIYNLKEAFPSLYARFDFAVRRDQTGTIIGVKAMEINGDTPTGLLETARLQFDWLQDLRPWLEEQHGEIGQFNQVYEKLVDRWVWELNDYKRRTKKPLPKRIHFAYTPHDTSGEDYMTTAVIMSAAEEAAVKMGSADQPAFECILLPLSKIGHQDAYVDGKPVIVAEGIHEGAYEGYFIDDNNRRIEMIFALWPKEYLLDPEHNEEHFGETLMHHLMEEGTPSLTWIEPLYKFLFSKGIWALMWQEYKDDPEIAQFLLPTYFEGDPDIPREIKRNRIRKALYGREGANSDITKDGTPLEAGVDEGYGAEGFILQELVELPSFDDPEYGRVYAIVCLWLIGDESCGILVREDTTRITTNAGRFAPHIIKMGV